ncbi:suppressor of fused family protein [Mycolicibacterium hassiacum DSM 44199]|uniref:Suppressor of fused family protein n=1 Tax=Mycolicibacterium hassiacum (strain DSM 44199 / CIP 105218 / JCM 12690 / 3849) TaxID=1122247 RepID=K5BAS9_MYCHD|nr:suppressor of fused family protein [Mycolicibacterium hassiacum DSM 44199]MDA4084091.1 hypothetical protein [Mycolicibacterium hassiacum DSM 44199]VCT91101.1 hypothetical protein MHAS_02815 [Mycolicibacterium hassiacum DSM 44199]
MIDVLAAVRARLDEHFTRAGVTAEPVAASVTFLGADTINVLRYGPDPDGVAHYVSLGCSQHPMADPVEMVTDACTGRARRSRSPCAGPPRGAWPGRSRSWLPRRRSRA